MLSIGYALYLFFIATFLAWLEIQIEGPNGWAEKLPCWRPKDLNSFFPKLYSRIVGGKPLTGYHLAVFAFTLVFIHLPFAAGLAWSLGKELETLSAVVLLWACEDFLWFIWNPAYGLKKFKPEFIWWHKKWIKRTVPVDYSVNLIQSAILVVIATPLAGPDVMDRWGATVGILAALTLISVLISQLWRKGRT